MNITLTAPPALTANEREDILRLNRWSTAMYLQLRRILMTLDTSNIISLDASRLTGEMSLKETQLNGTVTKITNDTFSIISPDGSQYLTYENGQLKFKGKVV